MKFLLVALTTCAVICIMSATTLVDENEVEEQALQHLLARLINRVARLQAAALVQRVCSGSIIYSSKCDGTFQHMHNCKQRGGKCCALNKNGTLSATRATNSQTYCGYCFN